MSSHVFVQPFLSHNDLRVEEKNRSGAHFPPVHEQPNLGKRVSVNLCHIAGLRIHIVPMIESFYFEKAFKRVENILHPVPTQTHLFLYTCTQRISTHTVVRPLAYNRIYRQILGG